MSDEARAFLDLPNFKPIQQLVMARMEQHLLDAAAAMSPDAIMKMFRSMLQTPDQFRDMFAWTISRAENHQKALAER